MKYLIKYFHSTSHEESLYYAARIDFNWNKDFLTIESKNVDIKTQFGFPKSNLTQNLKKQMTEVLIRICPPKRHWKHC